MLFVTWDGPGTTYYESLFLRLLSGSRAPGDSLAVMQFTWGDIDRSRRSQSLSAAAGIAYEAIEIGGAAAGRRPVHMARAIIGGARRLRGLFGVVDVVLARSVLPGTMVLAILLAPRGPRPRFIYDADGLPADERAEFGGWSKRRLGYWVFRAAELLSIRSADLVVVRTHEAVKILSDRTRSDPAKFHVVVNGTALTDRTLPAAAQRAATRERLGIPADAVVVAYVGSIGPQYRPAEMIGSVRAVRNRLGDRVWALFLSGGANHDLLRNLAASEGLDQTVVLEVAPDEVGDVLAVADLGLAYRTPSLSQRAVQPIKVSEYLAAGVPVAYTPEVGDLDSLLEPQISQPVRIGDPGDVDCLVSWLAEEVVPRRDHVRDACRTFAERHLSLARGIETYREALRKVGAAGTGRS